LLLAPSLMVMPGAKVQAVNPKHASVTPSRESRSNTLDVIK